MDKKKWLAAVILATLILPLFVYSCANYINGMKRPEDMVYVKPSEFEKAFNERMEPYGLSVDLASASWGYFTGGGAAGKTVPVKCTGGETIAMNLMTSGTHARDYVSYVSFDQTEAAGDRIWLPELMDTLLNIFQPSLAGERDYCSGETWSYPALSWNGAVDACRAFAEDDTQESMTFIVATERQEVPSSFRVGGSRYVAFEQTFSLKRNSEGTPSLSLALTVFIG